MTRSSRARIALAMLGLAFGPVGCGGSARVETLGGAGGAQLALGGAGGDSAAHPGGGAAGASQMRVPAKHRAAGASCVQQRAAVNPTPVDPNCNPPDSDACKALFTCAQDSDCKGGQNGRCVQPGAGPRRLTCSYDECFADAQCTSNAPCECRASASDGSPNSCLRSGNCRVDADCGEGGYCSPSLLNQSCFCPSAALCGADTSCSPGPCMCGDSCGHGYFCHSQKDTCLDDSDCADGSCNYDSVEKRWACARCLPIP
jgi:hypothetical protein